MVVILMSVVSAVLSRHSWHCNPVVYPFGARGEMMAYHLSGLTFIVEMSFIYYALITHARLAIHVAREGSGHATQGSQHQR